MAINLGDVNFRLGADARALRNSVRDLQDFGKTVDAAANGTTKGARQVESALRRQERASASALRSVQSLNAQFRRTDFGTPLVRRANMAFREYNAALTSGELTATQFQRAQIQFQSAIAATRREFQRLNADARAAAEPQNKLNEVLREMAAVSVLVTGPLGGIAARLTVLANVARNGGAALAALIGGIAAGVFTIQRFGGAVVQVGQQFRAFEQQLLSVTGNVLVASNALNEAIDIARRTGQVVESLVPSFARFTAAARGTSLEGEQTSEIFESVSLVMSRLQAPAEQVEGVFRALIQIMSKGQVQAEELRGQLGDRLPGAFGIAARAIGVTTAELNQMLVNGEVISTDFLPNFARELRRTFGLVGVRQVRNFQEAVNNLRNAYSELLRRTDQVTGASRLAESAIRALSNGIDFLTDNIETVIGLIGAATGALLSLAAPAVITGITAVGTAVAGLARAVATLNLAALAVPGGALVSVLLRLGAAIAGAVAGFALFTNAVRTNTSALDDGLQSVDDYISAQEGLERSSRAATETLIENVQAQIQAQQQLRDSLRDELSILVDRTQGQTAGAFFAESFERAIGQIGLGDFIETDREELNRLIEEIDTLGDGIERDKDRLERLAAILAQIGRDQTFTRNLTRASEAVTDLVAEAASLQRISAAGTNIADILRAEDIERARSAISDLNQDEMEALNNQLMAAGFSAGNLVTNYANLITSVRRLEEGIETNRELAESLKTQNAVTNDYTVTLSRLEQRIQALGMGAEAVKALEQSFRIDDTINGFRTQMLEAGFSVQETEQRLALLRQRLRELDVAERVADDLNRAMQELNAVGGRAVDTFFNSIIEGAMEGQLSLETLGDVAKSIAADLIQTFTRLAVINPLKNTIFGGTFPTINTGGLFATGFAGGFADGGFIPPGQVGLVGEEGAEFITAGPRGNTITPMDGSTTSTTRGGGVQPGVTVVQHNTFTGGVTEQDIQRMLPEIAKVSEEGVARRTGRGGTFRQRIQA